MNFIEKHLITSALVVFILCTAFFLLGETSLKTTFTEVAQYIPPAQTQTAAVYSVDSSSPELLTNGNMESATAWSDVGGTTNSRSNEQAHGGTYSWKVIYPSCCGWAGVYNSVNIPRVSAGQIYRLSGWVYVTSGNVSIAIKDYSEKTLGKTNITTTGSWQYAEVFVTIPSGVTQITTTAFFNNSSGTFYIDDFSLKRATGTESSTPPSPGTDTTTSTSTSPTDTTTTPTTPTIPTVPTDPPPSSPVTVGGVVTAASCAYIDVQAAIDTAKEGDTVSIPAGTCEWTGGITISGKSITVAGAGMDKTIIVDNYPQSSKGYPSATLITYNTKLGGNPRITGLTIDSARISGLDPSAYNPPNVYITGTSQTFRLDHTHFIIGKGNGITLNGDHLFGVIDHNIFDAVGYHNSIYVYASSWGGVQYGDGSWADAIYPGTEKAVYVESNTFNQLRSSLAAAYDGWSGGRIVFRYNTLRNTGTGSHGLDSSGRYRSMRSTEMYNNTFVIDSSTSYYYLGQFRGGTFITFNNTVTNTYPGTWVYINYRDFATFGQWGQCDGTSPWDLNDNVVYDSGVAASASNGKTSLTADGKSWSVDQWKGYHVINTTKRRSDLIKSNATNSLTPAGTGGFGSNITWSTGDTFEIRKPLSCMDQRGRGKGDLLSSVGQPVVNGQPGAINTVTKSASWPNHAVEPSYDWNNTLNGSPTVVEGSSPTMILGRDYLHSCMPGYTPYTYPHPLVQAQDGVPPQSVPLNCPSSSPVIPPATPPTTPKTADFNSDGRVNSLDFSALSSNWNQNSPTHDLNKDGIVNTLDYSILIQQWTG